MNRFVYIFVNKPLFFYSIFITFHIYGNFFIYFIGVPKSVNKKILLFLILFISDIYLIVTSIFIPYWLI